MGAIIGLIVLLFSNILGVALPALLAAWLFTLVLPVSSSQIVWLSLGMLLVTRYTIQNITDMPGLQGTDLIGMFIAVGVAYIVLALSGLGGWLLVRFSLVDLTLFEAIILFSVSLTAGFFFIGRAGTGGLPVWMTLAHEDESFEEEPPKRSSRRRRRTTRP